MQAQNFQLKHFNIPPVSFGLKSYLRYNHIAMKLNSFENRI